MFTKEPINRYPICKELNIVSRKKEALAIGRIFTLVDVSNSPNGFKIRMFG